MMKVIPDCRGMFCAYSDYGGVVVVFILSHCLECFKLGHQHFNYNRDICMAITMHNHCQLYQTTLENTFQLGFDQYGYTDTYTPFHNLYQTDTDTDICFEIYINLIPILIIGIYLCILNQYHTNVSAIIPKPIPILNLIYIKPITIPIQISGFISNRYRYLYDFILANTDTYYRYQYWYIPIIGISIGYIGLANYRSNPTFSDNT
jgi:hypothetical protein